MYFLCGWVVVCAQNEMKVQFRSRALLDAAVSGYGKEHAQGYYNLEDFRVGFKAACGQYEVKADIGLGDEKVAVKDMLFSYYFKHGGVLTLGNGYEPFSMDMLVSTADLRFHQSSASVLAFTDGRKLGATYHYSGSHCYFATGFYTNNDINTLGSESHKNSFVSTSRIVLRRVDKTHSLFHFGGAFSFRSRHTNVEEGVMKSMSSAGVTSMFPFPLLEANISDVSTEVKGLVELLYTAPRFMIQSEYFYDCLNRTNGRKSYCSHGGYIQGSLLLKGRGFEYDALYGVPGRPITPQSVELVLRFNYTDMNDTCPGILGGEEKDISLGVNFYLNRYFGVKFGGSYVWVGNYCNEFYQKNFLLTQLRLQYVF